MREGEQNRIHTKENASDTILLDDPGKEEVSVPLMDDSHHVQVGDNSQILSYVESMHLMDGHPFHDIADLLRVTPLPCDISSLEKMEWVQNQVIVASLQSLAM